MSAWRRTVDFRAAGPARLQELLHQQWLVTNGLGGYASGTLAGVVTWRYHGVLVAALPAPLGRTVMLNHLEEWLCDAAGRRRQFGGCEPVIEGPARLPSYLVEFRLERQIPTWRYDVDGIVLEKRVVMPNRQNTVHLTYTLLSPPGGYRIELRPAVHFRRFEEAVGAPLPRDYETRARGHRLEVDAGDGHPPLRLYLDARETRCVWDGGTLRELRYPRDAERGFESLGQLWSPGVIGGALEQEPVTLIASTEDWSTILALDPPTALATEQARVARLLRQAHPAAHGGPAEDLVLAADQFLVVPAGRIRDAARARAAGDELRSVIAGYHWFTDWGRDTMISLEGLALTTGRWQEAAWILRTFAHYVRDGLLPNLFPEGRNEGLYHTADATLWFFHAMQRYLQVTGDAGTLGPLLPLFLEIARHHLHGTKFGIGVDPGDGLLRQGADGYQLTWMDAKVGDWVVTPRRGKAVEINALWYNALRLLEGWLRSSHQIMAADEMGRHAERTRQAFNRRFWCESTGCLFDVVDGERGDDASVRPNQILAIALDHPVLAEERWEAVLAKVRDELLTPVGLRTLSRDHPDYKARYSGDLRARDAAYHQGTVWPWLMGPFINAWCRVYPKHKDQARPFLTGLLAHLDEACIGSVSEIFDAEEPFHPRGCIAQAWSVAELLRCWVLTAPESTTS